MGFEHCEVGFGKQKSWEMGFGFPFPVLQAPQLISTKYINYVEVIL